MRGEHSFFIRDIAIPSTCSTYASQLSKPLFYVLLLLYRFLWKSDIYENWHMKLYSVLR